MSNKTTMVTAITRRLGFTGRNVPKMPKLKSGWYKLNTQPCPAPFGKCICKEGETALQSNLFAPGRYVTVEGLDNKTA